MGLKADGDVITPRSDAADGRLTLFKMKTKQAVRALVQKEMTAKTDMTRLIKLTNTSNQ